MAMRTAPPTKLTTIDEIAQPYDEAIAACTEALAKVRALHLPSDYDEDRWGLSNLVGQLPHLRRNAIRRAQGVG